MKYCYIRISTGKQDFARQKTILEDKGYFDGVNCQYITEIYTGKTTRRPELNKLINETIKAGDTIISTELSRISRSVKDFNNLIDNIIYKKKVNVIILKENFNLLANGSMDAITKLILNITSSFAEFERDIISDRTKESLRAKKIHGTSTGRPIGAPRSSKSTFINFIKTLTYMTDNNVGQRKACIFCKYPEDTLKRDIKKCYQKYNTKDYKIILENIKKEGICEWEQF